VGFVAVFGGFWRFLGLGGISAPRAIAFPRPSWTVYNEQFNSAGKRLYLTDSERRKFLAAADDEERLVRSFCYVLAHTGCRISEALQLHAERIDFAAQAITFESLKKRKRGVYRAVPVPPAVLEMLAMVHGLKDRKKKTTKKDSPPPPLWDFGRTTAWKKVLAVMAAAGVKGPQATPKGLRHGFLGWRRSRPASP
jgi:integrase